MDIQFNNFLVDRQNAYGYEGHLPAEKLLDKIISHAGRVGYHCPFNLEPRDNFNGYQGARVPAFNYVWFDLDHEDTDGQLALDQAKEFIKWMGIEDASIWYSGSKGFHIGIHKSYLEIPNTIAVDKFLKNLATNLKTKFSTIDTSVYNPNRKFRAPWSKHEKTGRYKVKVNFEELMMVNDIQYFKDAGEKLPNPIPTFDDLRINEDRNALPQFKEFFNMRTSNEVVSGEAAAIEHNDFQKFDKKVCIKRLLDKRCNEGSRHETSLILISDMFQTGKHFDECMKIMVEWCGKNGMVNERLAEIKNLVSNVYSGKHKYNYGCKTCSIKAAQCSAKCGIFKKIPLEQRPNPIDGPNQRPVEIISNLKYVKQYENGIKPLPLTYNRYGKEEMPDELVCAGEIYNYFKNILIKQDTNIFKYTGKYWKEFEQKDHDNISKLIQVLCSEKAKDGYIKAVKNQLLSLIDHAPDGVNMFSPNPYICNFNNGSLHVIRENKKWRFEFREHNKLDYCNYVNDLDYDETRSIKNKDFLDTIDLILKGDPEKEDKIRVIKQMYGACLAPIYPRFFMVYGPAGKGKSTIIIPAKKMMNDKNISSLPPNKFNDFNMETMIGKLVNIDSDIPINEAIDDANLKKVEDRIPIYIDRKHMKGVYVPPPAIHIFGGNDIPATLERGSGAHDRRWTFLNLSYFEMPAKYDKDKANDMFEASPQGIINFALEGLEDILNSDGHYFNPKSGLERIKQWGEESDFVAQFIAAVKDNDVPGIKYDDTKHIKRGDLWTKYVEWHSKARNKVPNISNTKFYRVIHEKGHRLKTIQGVHVFEGFCIIGGYDL